jgi:hypothetical protein
MEKDDRLMTYERDLHCTLLSFFLLNSPNFVTKVIMINIVDMEKIALYQGVSCKHIGNVLKIKEQ